MYQKPEISVVIPTRMDTINLILGILACLKRQTFQDFEVIIVCDRVFSLEQWRVLNYLLEQRSEIFDKVRLFSHFNSEFQPKSPGGASYVRNFGILQARGNFIQLFDDDNRFAPDYLSLMLSRYAKLHRELDREVVLTPTLFFRDTQQIQNQGFSNYNYRLARPTINFHKKLPYAEIQMFSGNGVFARSELIKNTLYDEQIAWIAEDLDFVYRLYKKGAKILNFSQIALYHWEREKTILEQARIGTPVSALQKIKNIFLRHKKHANYAQFLIFIVRSSRGITLRLAFKALRYGTVQKYAIIKGLFQGYFRGWKLLVQSSH